MIINEIYNKMLKGVKSQQSQSNLMKQINYKTGAKLTLSFNLRKTISRKILEGHGGKPLSGSVVDE